MTGGNGGNGLGMAKGLAAAGAAVAETIFFLCAGEAMITGQTVIVDGGLTL